MREIITIQYDRGRMTIHLDKFLPTTQARLNKLLKINQLDWRNQDENLHQMIEKCKERIEEENQRKNWAIEKYIKNHQPMLDMKRIVENKKMPSGVMLNKTELKAKQEELRHLKAVVEAAMHDYKKAERNIKQLKANLLQLLRDWRKRK